MGNSLIERPRNTRPHVRPVVDYAADHPLRSELHLARKNKHIGGEIIGVPVGVIRIGSVVMCSDGKAGRVAGIVTHPDRSYPTHIVVRQGILFPRRFRVGFHWVSGIAADYVTLHLSKRDLVQQPVYRPDGEIVDAIEAAFHSGPIDGDRSSYVAVGATVDGGIVTLRGNVPSASHCREAEQIVAHMEGVIAVQNFLIADDQIEWSAAWALRQHPRLQTRDLRVEACLGLVRLQGRIASSSQRVLAAAIAGQVPGVRAIVNGLIVEPAPEEHAGAAVTVSQPLERVVVV